MSAQSRKAVSPLVITQSGPFEQARRSIRDRVPSRIYLMSAIAFPYHWRQLSPSEADKFHIARLPATHAVGGGYGIFKWALAPSSRLPHSFTPSSHLSFLAYTLFPKFRVGNEDSSRARQQNNF